ncbi:MAG: nicotinic acid mononucleotide adenylyltransferase, partial [Candidatus Omnitrophica bacterium]|nr:nicotinic acid mononucleotide adenylyltransferase [Candidatus Omnitrophota bacterium]
TIDTIRQLKKTYPKDELYFITGSDLLTYLNDWKDLNEIIGMVKFVVATRPGYPLEKIPSYIKTIAIRAVDISAFEIRQAIKQKRSFRYLVPEAVLKYIIRKRLYQ